MYKIVYEKRVFKDLDKIPNPDVERILESFQELSLNPHPPGSKKLSGKEVLYRVRQGDYRIVYAVDHREKVVKIILVSHRKEAYRQL
jgi:mRNA interferase RelE/StbE